MNEPPHYDEEACGKWATYNKVIAELDRRAKVASSNEDFDGTVKGLLRARDIVRLMRDEEGEDETVLLVRAEHGGPVEFRGVIEGYRRELAGDGWVAVRKERDD